MCEILSSVLNFFVLTSSCSAFLQTQNLAGDCNNSELNAFYSILSHCKISIVERFSVIWIFVYVSVSLGHIYYCNGNKHK